SVESGAALGAKPVLARDASRANGARTHDSTLGSRASTKDSTRIRVVIVSSRSFPPPQIRLSTARWPGNPSILRFQNDGFPTSVNWPANVGVVRRTISSQRDTRREGRIQVSKFP